MKRPLQTQFVRIPSEGKGGEWVVTKTHGGDPRRWIQDLRVLGGLNPPSRVVPPRVLDARSAARTFVPGVTLSELGPQLRGIDDFPGPCINLWLSQALSALAQLHMSRGGRSEVSRSHGAPHGGNLVVDPDGALWILDWGLANAHAESALEAEDARAEDVLVLARTFLDLYPSNAPMTQILREAVAHGSLPATALERRVMQRIHQGDALAPPSAAKHWLRHSVELRTVPLAEDGDPTALGTLSADELTGLPDTQVMEPEAFRGMEATDRVERPTDELFAVTVADLERGRPVPTIEGVAHDPSVGPEPELLTYAPSTSPEAELLTYAPSTSPEAELLTHAPSASLEAEVLTPALSVSRGEGPPLIRPVPSSSARPLTVVIPLALLIGGLAGWWGRGRIDASSKTQEALRDAVARELDGDEGPRTERVRILLEAHDGLLRGYPDRVAEALETLKRPSPQLEKR